MQLGLGPMTTPKWEMKAINDTIGCYSEQHPGIRNLFSAISHLFLFWADGAREQQSELENVNNCKSEVSRRTVELTRTVHICSQLVFAVANSLNKFKGEVSVSFHLKRRLSRYYSVSILIFFQYLSHAYARWAHPNRTHRWQYPRTTKPRSIYLFHFMRRRNLAYHLFLCTLLENKSHEFLWFFVLSSWRN